MQSVSLFVRVCVQHDLCCALLLSANSCAVAALPLLLLLLLIGCAVSNQRQRRLCASCDQISCTGIFSIIICESTWVSVAHSLTHTHSQAEKLIKAKQKKERRHVQFTVVVVVGFFIILSLFRCWWGEYIFCCGESCAGPFYQNHMVTRHTHTHTHTSERRVCVISFGFCLSICSHKEK